MTVAADRAVAAYRTALLAIGEAAADEVEQLLDRAVLSRPDGEENINAFAMMAAYVTDQNRVSAVALSAGWLADFASIVTGRPVLPANLNPAGYRTSAGMSSRAIAPIVGVSHPQVIADRRSGGQDLPPDRDLLRLSAVYREATIAERRLAVEAAEADIADRYAREAIARRQARKIAAHEVAEAGRRALVDAMDRTPAVVGWTRSLNGPACPVCTALADGTVLPTTEPMTDHPGCGCTPRPVLKGDAS